jgi:hypothetical protein
MAVDTWSLQDYLGHRNIQNTVRYATSRSVQRVLERRLPAAHAIALNLFLI